MDAVVLQSALVGEVMAREFDRVTPGLALREAAALIRRRRGRALVVDTGDDSPAIMTEFDVVKAVDDHGSVEDLTVGDRLTRVAVAGAPDWTLGRAIDTMLQGGFRHLIVMEDGEVVGMLSMRDIVEQFVEPTDHAEFTQDTVEIGMRVAGDSSRAIHTYRRTAKQHWVAAKCPCELDWLEVIIGQAESRSDITADEIHVLWDQRQPCPTLHAEGGGAD